MLLAKLRRFDGSAAAGAVDGERIRLFRSNVRLTDVLHADDPLAVAEKLVAESDEAIALADATLLAPIDAQEIWAAGVTYKRSKIAREEESAGAAQFYDKVYTAPRPELFFKATPSRVSHPGGGVRIRSDASWSVPEPEFALIANPAMKIVGYTIGNDMSSRDIEGENPLYLPQAKVYAGSCAIGPFVRLAQSVKSISEIEIGIVIERSKKVAFEGTTTLASLNRTPEELIGWLFKDNAFPDGAVLLTGTGIVPPDAFTLAIGDVISITISGIGTLRNAVVA